MFRPPAWDILEDTRKLLPGTIAALGTSDEKTYLIIGASPAAGSIDADMKASDAKLRDLLDHYRPLGDSRATIAGVPAVERRFRGSIDGRDWSGIVVLLERGKDLYTILGMTFADNDLVQIQENVLHRTIDSIQFTK
jgi:hypothetical protein